MEWFKASTFFNDEVKENSKEYRKLFADFCQSNEYKTLEKREQCRQFIAFAKAIECDKLNTFIQIENNQVAILQSPPDKVGNKSNKAQIVKFLGYDWSNRKGDEGIKYVTNKSFVENGEDVTDNDDSDTEAVTAINSIKYIDTPLYNPNDAWDCSKFAFAIRKHIYGQCRKFSFGENEKEINADFNGEMGELFSFAKLSDMVDFSRTEFDKAIKLTADKKIEIVSKYPLVRLGGDDGVCNILIGGTPSRKNAAYFTGNNLWVSIAEMKGQVITDTKEKITDAGVKNSNVKLIPKGTTLLSFKLSIGKTAIAGVDLYTNEAIAALIPKETNPNSEKYVSDEYLFALFNGKLIDLENVGNKAFGKSLNSAYLNNEVKIPLPPSDIQQKIVSECEKVDEEYNNSRMSIEEYKKKIAEVMANIHGIKKRLGEMAKSISTGPFGTMIHKEDYIQDGEYCLINPQDIVECKVCYDSIAHISEKTATRLCRYKLQKNDIVVARRGDLSKCAIITEKDTNCLCGTGSFFIQLDNAKIDSKFFLHLFVSKEIQDVILKHSIGLTMPNLNQTILNNLELSVPSLSEQQRIVSEIESYEAEIAKAKVVMAGCAERKRQILEKYLK